MDNQFNIQIKNLAVGNYTAKLFNSQAAGIFDWTIVHSGVTATHTLNMVMCLTNEVYILKLTGNGVAIEIKVIKQYGSFI